MNRSNLDVPDLEQLASQIVKMVLEHEPLARTQICEASVHRPARSRIWQAVYTAANGGQTWRSTGTSDYNHAMLLARKWEAQARALRAKLGRVNEKPVSRVRRTTPTAEIYPLTQREVAQILHISERAVRQIERRAIRKLFSHPTLRRIWQQYLAGDLEEEDSRLTASEIAALYSLGQTPNERRLIEKVLRMVQG